MSSFWSTAKWGKGKGDYLLLAVEPGVYQLEELKSTTEQHPISYWMPEGGATFEAKAGDVIYLGDLVLQYCFKGKVTGDLVLQDYFKWKVTAEDFFDEAKKFILNEYSHLAPKLKKNLVQVSK